MMTRGIISKSNGGKIQIKMEILWHSPVKTNDRDKKYVMLDINPVD